MLLPKKCSNVNLLNEETQNSTAMAQEIRGRAKEVGETSRKSFESASTLAKQFEERLAESIENAKVVSSIEEMANVISGNCRADQPLILKCIN